jgi:[glutamine synthetase] adenylyltransferase / [glutamine synthetase]-adenylyl-L-tyrosine phosphorylase
LKWSVSGSIRWTSRQLDIIKRVEIVREAVFHDEIRRDHMPSLRDTRSTSSASLETLFGSLQPATASFLRNSVENSFDKERLEHYLTELHGRYPGLLDRVRELGQAPLAWLSGIFSCSRFLSEELLQHPDWLFEVPGLHAVLPVSGYSERLLQFVGGASTRSPQTVDLATFRRRELLRIVLRDVLSLDTLAGITEELSNLADAILQEALREIVVDLRKRYGLPSDALDTESGSGFSVIALGKLGGRELNYSSDIDLMFLYRGNGETAGPNVITNREFYKKVANRYTDLLATYTPEGLCYRVDLRLRPEGKFGEICTSLEGAKQYYSLRARDWELQMLIKARTVAGEISVGRDLLQSVESSIYSTTTDFSAIETMSATRERLAGKLSSKRLPGNELDVKLTPGGIRDIEFLVQCLQRLHGGRDETVRHGGTIFALSRLFDRDLISATEHSRLYSAYEFLRHLEHGLQFEDDRQTHTLPSNPQELDRLAMVMPARLRPTGDARPGVELLRALNQHLENVQAIYGRIVHAQRPPTYEPLHAVVFEEAPEPSSAAGRTATGARQDNAEELIAKIAPKAPLFADYLSRKATLRSASVLEAVWEPLAGSPELLAEVDRNPVVAGYLLQVLNLSPYFTEQLKRDITLMDEISGVAGQPNRRAAFEGLATPLNDIAALRRFFRREMFRIQVASMCVPEPVFQTLDRTSALAEFMIARAYRIALERSLAHARREVSQARPFAEPQDEMMVVALGRLGMREFDLGSDADLLFIIPDSEAERQKFWTRVAEHVVEILTSYTGDGAVLSIDTRLRPNGREGLLVQTESKYTDYFAHHSEAWEGIAYMKARAVAGDIERATTFLRELQQVDWRRWGQSGRSKQDLKQMRLRIDREHGGGDFLKAGPGGYYDADFALMYLRLKGAGLFFKTLNTPERIDIVEKMGHLERPDAEFLQRATTFYRAVDHGIRVSRGHPGGKLPKSPAELETLTELVDRWTAKCPRAGSLDEELKSTRKSMRELFERLFG